MYLKIKKIKKKIRNLYKKFQLSLLAETFKNIIGKLNLYMKFPYPLSKS